MTSVGLSTGVSPFTGSGAGGPPASVGPELSAALSGKANSAVWDFADSVDSGGVLSTVNLYGAMTSQLSQSNNDRKPGVHPERGFVFNGSDNLMTSTGVVSTSIDLFVAFRIKKDVLDAGPGNIIAGRMIYEDDSATNSGIGLTPIIDGVTLTSRDEVHDALDDDSWHTLEFAAGPWPTFAMNLGNSSDSMSADLRFGTIIRRSDFATEAEFNGAAALARTFLGEFSG